jgi:hypothetical protein
MISKDYFEDTKRLLELDQEQLQIAIKSIENLAEDNSSKYPDEIKSKISNVLALLEEIDEFYSEVLQEEYEDYKDIGEDDELD